MENSQPQNLKLILVRGLREKTESEVLATEDTELAMTLAQITTEVSFETALRQRKIFQVRDRLGYQDTFKILAFILKNFVDSIRIKEEYKIRSVELFSLVDEIIKTYSHDSIEDIILALKLAKRDHGKWISVGESEIWEALKLYFGELRPAFLENQAKKLQNIEATDQKAIYRNAGEEDTPILQLWKKQLGPPRPKGLITEQQLHERLEQLPPLKKMRPLNEKEFTKRQKKLKNDEGTDSNS